MDEKHIYFIIVFFVDFYIRNTNSQLALKSTYMYIKKVEIILLTSLTKNYLKIIKKLNK